MFNVFFRLPTSYVTRRARLYILAASLVAAGQYASSDLLNVPAYYNDEFLSCLTQPE
jgi:hypothetical protein